MDREISARAQFQMHTPPMSTKSKWGPLASIKKDSVRKFLGSPPLVIALTAVVSCFVGGLLALSFGGNLQGFLSGPGGSSSARIFTGKSLGRWAIAKWLKIAALRQTKLHRRDITVPLWPMPFNVTHGESRIMISPKLEFVTSDGSLFPRVIANAAARYHKLIFEGREDSLQESVEGFEDSQILLALEISVLEVDVPLSIGVDESYSLYVPSEAKPAASLVANTVWGALRGLETFSQLCQFDFQLHAYIIVDAPWIIHDKPRFGHRGLLVDTSRHYQPVAILEQILDAMSYSKLNVFHWHMVDQQSFPIEIPSFPNLWNGAYSKNERFSFADIAHIVQYAADRGVVVVPEIDVPGHAESWGVGYPELWPSNDCRMPLDISSNFTFELIRGILRDLKSVIPYTTFHFGGDEVNWTCWQVVPKVKEWLNEQHLSALDAYMVFVTTARDIALEEGWETVILWEETYQNFGEKLNDSVIVENWLNPEVKEGALSVGLRVLVSLVSQGWYLDHPEHDWWDSYSLEPCSGLRAPRLCQLIVGGETCMWTEHADPSNIVSRIWPRAAASAERLWTPQAYTSNVAKLVAMKRIMTFKCLLHRRGISSNYVNHKEWHFYFEPGSCYTNR